MSNDKKVFLVKCLDPSRRNDYAFKQIPMGIAYLAANLKGKCDLEIFDMLVDNRLIEKIQKDQPDVVGISVFSVDFVFAKKLINEIKQASPNSLIVAGGAHATVEAEQVLNCGVDIVIRSEGERSFTKIIEKLNNNSSNFECIPGLSYFDSTSEEVKNNPVELEREIDNLPMPAFEFFDSSKYNQYPLLTSRGCPFSCRYCASKTIWGQRARFHSAERVFAEIKRVVENYGYANVVFIDDTFTLKHGRLMKICDYIIRSGYNITWSVNSRVDTMNRKIAEKISQAGCKVVSFGIESGSDKIQDSIQKKINISQMKEAVMVCKEFGIRVKTGWMIGLPFGNYEEQMKSLDVMLDLEPDEISIHHFIPMPGTPYWNNPELYGMSFNKQRLLESFSIDAMPEQIGLKFDYISNKEIEMVTSNILKKLYVAGYKRPGEIGSYDLKSKVVNTYMDRGRLSVLPSEK